jgi:hypothetical protein
MTVKHVVVDGSNIATEGRTLPSLVQLDEAVRSFIDQYEPGTVAVVVDASFPNRIDPSERETYEEAILAGELVTPPAGVIGRGDAFLLEIADRADAVVLSNDSFQEFHGSYEWLFEQGRLIGGKPVPHVGWVFMERSPVRGPLSRRAVSEAKKARRKAAAPASESATSEAAAPDGAASTTRSRRRRKAGEATDSPKSSRKRAAAKSSSTKRPAAKPRGGKAPVPAAELAAEGGGRRRRRTSKADAPSGVQPYNEPLPFIEFVGAHPVGSLVDGEVEQFSSHGAYVLAEGTRCYLPLKHMADPAPRSAKEVMQLGERYTFEVHAFDTPRRGVDLAIPGVVSAAAEPEAIPPELAVLTTGNPVDQPTEEERVAPAKKTTAKKASTRKAPAKKSAAKKSTAKKSTARKSAAKKASTRKAPARKSAAKKSTAKKAPARKSTAKKSTAKKSAAKKAPAKKSTPKKSTTKRSTAKKASTRKAPAKKAASKRSR